MGSYRSEPIAIVGSACRFPGSANTPSKLWDLLKSPRDVLKEFPPDRLNLQAFYRNNGEVHGCTNVRNRSYLLEDDCRVFDAAFFRISPNEAHGMDPQQRILLETIFEATEEAGWPLEAMEGSLTSVHVGCMTADYNDIQMRDPDSLPTYAATGLARSILANRISYFFDLRGPSVTVDTACSSSLVALHHAVQGLRSGEADQAIVAGVNLLLDPSMYISEATLHMLSWDSRCRMWDRQANGYARGEGCGAIILKPLSKAVTDGDHIECVIRETAVNSDGRTTGITMPSAEAQARLIRTTYERAGLDISADGCQYFECHGTGTQAGDPVEARAISEAFFSGQESSRETPLYCGSVKTVIGHLEGAAGLAGLMKASLAIQNRTIPPNMHFNGLSPAIEPYYGHLQVPTSALPWPDTYGQPLRASVNSFGFGGTNAHVILESYQEHWEPSSTQQAQPHDADEQDDRRRLPNIFVFSAKNPASLRHYLSKLGEHIQTKPSLNLDLLSRVLHSRRSAFAFRMPILAASRSSLLEALQKRGLSSNTSLPTGDDIVRSLDSGQMQPPGILGIFTGQGAQWVSMGCGLASHSATFRKSLMACDQALQQLQDGPSWSLLEVMANEDDSSPFSLSKAQFSQPVCTAIQIALCDLLGAVGVKFDAVVGHSSGEIGAAYAAGFLDARAAMGIAYYRGLVAADAKGADGQDGSMMAVAMSHDDAISFCSQAGLQGHITVAASNGPSSVTLSGDSDAIDQAQQLLEEKLIFARKLRVDAAYHSHHMRRCEYKYSAYLRRLQIQVKAPKPGCTWYSSVHLKAMSPSGDQPHLDQLKDQYWVDNMTQPVLFSGAVQAAFQTDGPFSVALEVGPHPALKGPVNQSIQSSSTPQERKHQPLLYTSCLERGLEDVQVMANALGLVWSCLGRVRIDLGAWHRDIGTERETQPPMMKGLPSYAWVHDQIYWHESRPSHHYRLGQYAPHELLGRVREVRQQEISWRNILHLDEVPWLRGHVFQGQVLFPGAGYISMAVQAAKVFAQELGHDVKLVEVRDTSIIKAVVIEEDSLGVEMLFNLKGRERFPDDTTTTTTTAKTTIDDDRLLVEADFTVYVCSDQRTLSKCSECRVLLHVATSTPSLPNVMMPESVVDLTCLPQVDTARFFSAVSSLGIAYGGPFHALQSIRRARGHARATASWKSGELGNEHVLHPAVLDVAFQVGFASFLSMAEKSMASAYLPTSIRSAVVDISQLSRHGADWEDGDGENAEEVRVFSQRVGTGYGPTIEVDLDICSPKDTASPTVQIEGLTFKAVGEPLAIDDRLLFSKTVWDSDVAYGIAAPDPPHAQEGELEYIDAVERTALFFLRTLGEQTPAEEVKTFKSHHQALFRAIALFLRPISEGRHEVIKKAWLSDTREVIEGFSERYHGSVDLALLTAVGENLPTVVRGQSEMLEHMLKDNLLSRLYTEGRGFSTCNEYVAEFLRQITFKYPKVRILEIGAGTGGTTASVLEAIGDVYVSYTYTDISAGFFERAAERFAAVAAKMEFRTLNVEHSPCQQGFQEGSYDVVIAANVLHATRRLADAMRNVRSLLRPGGYLVAVEVTGSMLREPGLMGGLEGWWLGEADGRFPSPGISAKAWDQVLGETGFSGIDAIVYDMADMARHNCSSFVTQAMDRRVEVLRNPLERTDLIPEISQPVLVFGGHTLPAAKCIQKAQSLLRRWMPQIQIHTFADLDELGRAQMDTARAQVLYLAELDAPLFCKPLTQARLESLQELVAGAQNILWVTSGRRAEKPQANMTVGIGRALAFELPHVRMQFLDFETGTPWDAETMVQHLLRMMFLSSLPQDDPDDSRILWSHEPEVVVVDGATLVSRVIMDNEANAQFNAGRRRMERRAGPREPIEICYTTPRPSIVLGESDRNRPLPSESHSIVDVALSTPLVFGNGEASTPCFLAFGKCRPSGNQALVLSSSDGSTARVSDDDMLGLAQDVRVDASHLSTIASAILGRCCSSLMPEEGTSLVFEPVEDVAEAVWREAANLGRNVVFVSSGTDSVRERPFPWLLIHPLERRRAVVASLPADTAALLYFSSRGLPPKRILEALPQTCTVQEVNPAGRGRGKDHLAPALAVLSSLPVHTPEIVTLDRIEQQQVAVQPKRRVLDWRERGGLHVSVPPLKTRGFFAPDKTYLLVGMTGELGQSLCQFMIDCGARHIVLASRDPPSGNKNRFRSPDKTVELQVRMVRMDVTSREQVQAAVLAIKDTMPEIAGVANAALVLEDSLFVNTTTSSIEKQLRPKVDGTTYLDEEFSGCDLDFFVCFSSLASVFGNAGQSIYHAANMFMTSLIERRRRRGEAGSVIHVGMIVDAGYVARSTRAGNGIEKHLRSQYYMPLSEHEFHCLMLQAVLAGRIYSRPGHPRYNGGGGEVIMGIQRFIDDPDTPTRPQWYHDPRLSHMAVPASASTYQASSSLGSTKRKKELRSMLDRALSVSEAAEIYRSLLCIKIESMMKIPVTSVDTAAPLFDLGMDSLLAVELRAWLLREMGLDVPLLRILSKESVSTICAAAAQQHVEHTQTARAEAGSPNATTSIANTASSTTGVDAESVSVSVPSTPITPSEPPGNEAVPEPRGDEVTLAEPSRLQLSHSPAAQREEPSTSVPSAPSGFDVVEDAPDVAVPERVEPMSYSQASMHFLHDFLADPTTFNVVAHYKVKGPMRVSRFSRALDKVLARHEAYRTRFYSGAGGLEPKQCVGNTNMPASRAPPSLVRVQSSSPSEIASAIARLEQRRWQLTRAGAFQCVLLTQGNGEDESAPSSQCEHHVVFGCHHIIMDGMSWHIFLGDLDRAYRLLPLEPVPFTYAQFSRRQGEDIQSGRLDESLAFWMRRWDPVPDVMPLLLLSHRRSRQPSRIYENHTVQEELAPQEVQQIKTVAQGYGATPMQFCLAALQILLVQVLDLDDDVVELCIGLTDAGRGTTDDFRETIGHFTNLLPIKFQVGRQDSVADVVSKTSQIVSEAYEHAHVPLDMILERLQMQRSMANTPLFQIAYNYRLGSLLTHPLGDCQMDLVAYRDARTPYDFTVNITQGPAGGQLVEVTSNAYLYTRAATQRLLDMYMENLARLPNVDKSHRLRASELLSSGDAERLGSRGVKCENAWPTTLIGRLQQVWDESPGSPAIKDEATTLTYAELRIGIQDLVRALLGTGVRAGMRVAVLCVPGVEIHTTMLALLWIGAVYVPLDPTLPAKRHVAMLDACKPEWLVFHEPTAASLEAIRGAREGEAATTATAGAPRTYDLAESTHASGSTASSPPHTALPPPADEGTYSFILFTSGSSGTPKGIKLSQAGIMNYAASKSALLGIASGVRVLQQSSSGFDMALAQAFNAFCNAGELVVAPSRARGDPTMIAQLMASEALEFTLATPTEYLALTNYANHVLSQCTSWRFACSGGEVVTEGLINELQRLELGQLTLTDCYGPTEISCAATFRRISLGAQSAGLQCLQQDGLEVGESSSVGRPLPNTSLYILASCSNSEPQPLPSGQVGEVCIGGCGVARGYIDEDLNRGKFVLNPFATSEDVKRGWRTMYRTGDKGCLLPDGSLLFLGRMHHDDLVKLRGLRIELGEISRAILDAARGALTDAVVTVRGQPEFLVAHVVFVRGSTTGTVAQQQQVLDRVSSDLHLPRYMIPSFIIPLDRLPTNANGKVDRSAIASLTLPSVRDEGGRNVPQQPLTVPQGELRLLWKEVLAGDVEIRADSDFFTVGGSSLLLVRLQNLLKERMGVQIPLHELYGSSTLGSMAALASHERGRFFDKESLDWEAETAIPTEIHELIRSDALDTHMPAPPPSRPPQLRILLTGATGFLGSEILRALLLEPDVAEVHCIAVPADSKERQGLLATSDKITMYTGSLLSPTLGLNTTEQHLLRTGIHAIIHAGSQGHCLNNYGSVRQANYLSTQFLARLALPRRIPLHFVSSPRVILQSGSCTSSGGSMAAHLPPSDGLQGFTASKWASERFLERVVAATRAPTGEEEGPRRPLSVVVHRACSLIGDRAPHDDAMNSVIRFSVLSGAVPHLPQAQGFFDFKDVSEVAADVARYAAASAATACAAGGGGGPDSNGALVFQHHSSNVRVPFNDLAARLGALHGGTFTVVSMKDWIRRALQLGIEELIVSYLEANMAGGSTLMFPYLGK